MTPILKFDRRTGKVLASFGAGLFVLPHGIHVDRDGNVWVTDGQGNKAGTKGHQVIKFSPEGRGPDEAGPGGRGRKRPRHLQRAVRRHHGAERRHLRLGRPQRAEPTSCPPAPRAHHEVHEGRQVHQGMGTDRIGAGRVPDAPRAGVRLAGPAVRRRPRQPSHPDLRSGRQLLDAYEQFGRVSGLFITPDDMLYAIDSESDQTSHPGWRTGVRIGKASEDKVTAFIPPHFSDTSPWASPGKVSPSTPRATCMPRKGRAPVPQPGGGLTNTIDRVATILECNARDQRASFINATAAGSIPAP